MSNERLRTSEAKCTCHYEAPEFCKYHGPLLKTAQLPSKPNDELILLREARDALDAIARERDDVRWDLAKRIDELLQHTPETSEYRQIGVKQAGMVEGTDVLWAERLIDGTALYVRAAAPLEQIIGNLGNTPKAADDYGPVTELTDYPRNEREQP